MCIFIRSNNPLRLLLLFVRLYVESEKREQHTESLEVRLHIKNNQIPVFV